MQARPSFSRFSSQALQVATCRDSRATPSNRRHPIGHARPPSVRRWVVNPRRTFLTASWRYLAMLNFRIDPDVLRPFVPAGTELDTWRGDTLVSVVGFRFLDARLFGLPIPFHRDFDEINLRFYVRRSVGGESRRGVTFIREIVPRRAVAAVARLAYNEPYLACPTRSVVPATLDAVDAGTVGYAWNLEGRWHALRLRSMGPPAALERGSEEEFISEHFWGYTRQRNGRTIEYRGPAPVVARVEDRRRRARMRCRPPLRRAVRRRALRAALLGVSRRRIERRRVQTGGHRSLSGSRRCRRRRARPAGAGATISRHVARPSQPCRRCPRRVHQPAGRGAGARFSRAADLERASRDRRAGHRPFGPPGRGRRGRGAAARALARRDPADLGLEARFRHDQRQGPVPAPLALPWRALRRRLSAQQPVDARRPRQPIRLSRHLLSECGERRRRRDGGGRLECDDHGGHRDAADDAGRSLGDRDRIGRAAGTGWCAADRTRGRPVRPRFADGDHPAGRNVRDPGPAAGHVFPALPRRCVAAAARRRSEGVGRKGHDSQEPTWPTSRSRRSRWCA